MNTPTRYRKKPVVIEAMQLTQTNAAEVKRLRLADHPDNEECASCTHAYVRDLEEDNDTMTEELLRLREVVARLTAAADIVQRRGVEGGFTMTRKETPND